MKKLFVVLMLLAIPAMAEEVTMIIPGLTLMFRLSKKVHCLLIKKTKGNSNECSIWNA